MLPHQLISRRYPLSLIYSGVFDTVKGEPVNQDASAWFISSSSINNTFSPVMDVFSTNLLPKNKKDKYYGSALRHGERNPQTYNS